MRYFPLLDFQYSILAVFFGVVSVILVFMAWGSYPLRRRKVTEEEVKREEGHELPGGHHSEENPIAPFLFFVYAGVVLWTIAYIVFVGVLGGPIG